VTQWNLSVPLWRTGWLRGAAFFQFLTDYAPQGLLYRFLALEDVFAKGVVQHRLIVSAAGLDHLIAEPVQDVCVQPRRWAGDAWVTDILSVWSWLKELRSILLSVGAGPAFVGCAFGSRMYSTCLQQGSQPKRSLPKCRTWNSRICKLAFDMRPDQSITRYWWRDHLGRRATVTCNRGVHRERARCSRCFCTTVGNDFGGRCAHFHGCETSKRGRSQ
jgi:hypothetical protein